MNLEPTACCALRHLTLGVGARVEGIREFLKANFEDECVEGREIAFTTVFAVTLPGREEIELAPELRKAGFKRVPTRFRRRPEVGEGKLTMWLFELPKAWQTELLQRWNKEDGGEEDYF